MNGEKQILLTFGDNKLLSLLFGEEDKNLARIEEKLGVSASSRGNTVALAGDESNVKIAKMVLEAIYAKLEKNQSVGMADIDAAIRMAGAGKNGQDFKKDVIIKTQRKQIFPYSPHQADYMKALMHRELTFASGPAGTGKTYLAVAAAVAMFLEKKVDRIILSRPAVEAGEKLGFLPGDLKEKVDPYLRPLYDALYDMMPSDRVNKCLELGEIEIAPLAFMRGRTLSHAFIILDEAQNATTTQMKMFLTRLGEGSRMSVSGDLSQTDLPGSQKSGLRDAIQKLKGIAGIEFVRFEHTDIVRHELTVKIVEAYEKHDRQEKREGKGRKTGDSREN